MAVTKEAIFEVATVLADAGEKPTSISIRERLGTGSYSTISAYLREWQASRKSVSTVQSEDIPPEIRESGNRFLLAVWTSAKDWLKGLAESRADQHQESSQ